MATCDLKMVATGEIAQVRDAASLALWKRCDGTH